MLRILLQKVNSKSSAFIEHVVVFEPQNNPFLVFDLLALYIQLIGSEICVERKFVKKV